MLNDLMAGVISASFGDPTLVTLSKAGKVKVLGASSDGTWSIHPGVEPMKNTVSGFIAENWYGLLAPPNTPKAIVDILRQETVAIMNDAKIVKMYAEQGQECATMESTAFKEYVKRDSGVWASVIKDANIQI
jgi:tripartite-type tricarboxylate transporter receptor subunit TctC